MARRGLHKSLRCAARAPHVRCVHAARAPWPAMHDWKAEDWVRFSSTSVSLVFTSAFLIKSLIHRNFRPFSRLVTTLLIWSNWVQSVSNMVSLFITKYNSTYTECVATGILRCAREHCRCPLAAATAHDSRTCALPLAPASHARALP